MTKKFKIFLDIDGVVGNWTGHALATMGLMPLPDELRHHVEANESVSTFMDVEELWRRVKLAGPDWWATVPFFPWARRLWHVCNKIAPTTFLSTPWYGAGDDIMADAASGKTHWVRKKFKTDNFLLGVHKEFCASPRALLIDDNKENCRKFLDDGGFAFHWPNSIKMARDGSWNRTILNLLGYIDLIVLPVMTDEERRPIKIMQTVLRKIVPLQSKQPSPNLTIEEVCHTPVAAS